MKLTVVLVTQPARVHYFAESLECIAEALEKHLELELLVIFNGKSDSGEDKLKPIQDAFPTRVSSRIIEVNNPMPDGVFKIIREENLRWIHMPGDDDLVIPKAYSAFFDLMSEKNSYVAVAFSAIAIDSEGTPSGKVLKPLDFNGERKERILAVALHKPLFVWPSLIFDATCVPEKLFSSRFVFDWWVGIHLSFRGAIYSVKQSLVQYRVHKGQESFHAPEMRKRFEAEIMLQNVLTENAFWTELDSVKDVSVFLHEISESPPVYGDPRFGGSIYCIVANKCSTKNQVLPHSLNAFLSHFASSKSAYLRMSEFPSKLADSIRLSPALNFRGNISNNTCDKVAASLTRIMNPDGPTIGFIGCYHSLDSKSTNLEVVIIDCESVNATTIQEIDNLVILQLEAKMDRGFQSESQLAPWEKTFIEFARKTLQRLRRVGYFLNPRRRV